MTRKHAVVAAAALTLGVATGSSVAMADNESSQGDHSTGRNEAGFGGGPHCHVIETVAADGSVAYIEVYPSHMGHASSAGHGPFIADGNCDGMP